ncbi:MAG: hypothetical protein ABUK01_11485 [Leptospirales bacterium]
MLINQIKLGDNYPDTGGKKKIAKKIISHNFKNNIAKVFSRNNYNHLDQSVT